MFSTVINRLNKINKQSLENFRIIASGGVQPLMFLEQVGSNPYENMNNNRLQSRFVFMKRNFRYMVLSPQEKALMALILNKNQYQECVSEVPHLLYSIWKYKSRVHTFPSINSYNPTDYKIGDLFVNNNKISIESKTLTVLLPIKCEDIGTQYGQNPENKNADLRLQIIYKSLPYSGNNNNVFRECFSILKKAGFQEQNCSFIHCSELQGLKKPEVLEEIFSMYNIPTVEFAKEHYSVLENHLLDIQSHSKCISLGVQKELNLLQQERDAFLNPLQVRNQKKHLIYYNFRSAREQEIEAQEIASLPEPEDFLEDTGDWFGRA